MLLLNRVIILVLKAWIIALCRGKIQLQQGFLRCYWQAYGSLLFLPLQNVGIVPVSVILLGKSGFKCVEIQTRCESPHYPLGLSVIVTQSGCKNFSKPEYESISSEQ